jgi:NAD(P)-dependent dehydrogenase (short-subunit alcohol dehydrogenase family)
MSLEGQVAVITGGGRGLGRAYAQTLAAAGAAVAVLARSADELAETVGLVRDAGGRSLSFPVDVADAAAVRTAFAEIERSLGPVDLLVNNAGIIGPIGPFWEIDPEVWWQGMDVNLRGALLCAHAVLPGMVARKRGRIVNVVTAAAPLAYLSSYITSKSALVRAAECMAVETKPLGISIFSIVPGTVRTSMTETSLFSPAGREWIPWYRRFFDEQLDVPAERSAQLVLSLASGAFDELTGLYVSVFDDLPAIAKEIERVRKEQLHSMRVRVLAVNPALAAIGALREVGERAQVSQTLPPAK